MNYLSAKTEVDIYQLRKKGTKYLYSINVPFNVTDEEIADFLQMNITEYYQKLRDEFNATSDNGKVFWLKMKDCIKAGNWLEPLIEPLLIMGKLRGN